MLYMANPNQLVLFSISPHLLTHPHLHSLPILPSLTATVMKQTFSLCAGTMSYQPTTRTPPPCSNFSLTNISTTKAIMFGGAAEGTLLKDYVQLLDMLSWVGHHCWYMCSMCSCMIHVYVILCMYTCTYYTYVLQKCHTV